MASSWRGLMALACLLLLAVVASATAAAAGNRTRSLPGTFELVNGVRMPTVGFGTAGLGHRGEESVYEALRAGFQLLDTAQATEWYDEGAVGRAIRRSGVPRGEIFVTTKVHPRHFGYERTLKSIDESLAALGLEQIDLVLLHAASCDQWGDICPPDPNRGSFLEAWRALETAYEQGKLRAIGVSNFDVSHLEAILGHAETQHPVMVIQNWMDPLNTDQLVLEWALEHGAVYTSYSTLGGQWQWRNANGHGGNPVLAHPTIRRIAAKHKVSPVITVLAWALLEGVSIIPRSSNPQHIQELADGLLPEADGLIRTVFLDEDDMEAIRAMEEEWEETDEGAIEGGLEEEL